MTIDPDLLEILVCPSCRGPLCPPAESALECKGCGRKYPIRDGIPVMLVDEAGRADHDLTDSGPGLT